MAYREIGMWEILEVLRRVAGDACGERAEVISMESVPEHSRTARGGCCEQGDR